MSQNSKIYIVGASVTVTFGAMVDAPNAEVAEKIAFGIGERLQLTSMQIEESRMNNCCVREVALPAGVTVKDVASGKFDLDSYMQDHHDPN